MNVVCFNHIEKNACSGCWLLNVPASGLPGIIAFDAFVKSPNSITPAKAGVQKLLKLLVSGFRRNDGKGYFSTFYESISF